MNDEKSHPSHDDGQPMTGGGSRSNAKAMLRREARFMRDTAARLDALCEALPERLPDDADAALYELVRRAQK